MPNATKQQRYVGMILDFLKDHPTEYFDQSQIVAALIDQIDEKGSYHIEYPIQALLAAGLIHGHIRGIKVVSIRYKEPGPKADPTMPTEPMVPRVTLERALTQFKNDLSIAQAALDTARQQAAMAATKERIVKVVIERSKKPAKEFTETYHSKFEDILTLASLRENIFLYGPMGSGKTYIGAQLARHLDLPFSFTSCSSGISDSVLTGMLFPFGEMGRFEYASSEFLKRYEEGGVYLLDEIDRSDANILVVLNSALAGDVLAVPKRKDQPYAKKHPDFICIAAGNTLGNGADRMYSTANKLDAATMDRFSIGKILVDYDENVEKTLCPDDELRARLMKHRKAINAHRLERAVSSRFMEKAYKLKQSGWSLNRIDEALMLGWREDEINKVMRS